MTNNISIRPNMFPYQPAKSQQGISSSELGLWGFKSTYTRWGLEPATRKTNLHKFKLMLNEWTACFTGCVLIILNPCRCFHRTISVQWPKQESMVDFSKCVVSWEHWERWTLVDDVAASLMLHPAWYMDTLSFIMENPMQMDDFVVPPWLGKSPYVLPCFVCFLTHIFMGDWTTYVSPNELLCCFIMFHWEGPGIILTYILSQFIDVYCLFRGLKKMVVWDM